MTREQQVLQLLAKQQGLHQSSVANKVPPLVFENITAWVFPISSHAAMGRLRGGVASDRPVRGDQSQPYRVSSTTWRSMTNYNTCAWSQP
jgi:hypothetical protein